MKLWNYFSFFMITYYASELLAHIAFFIARLQRRLASFISDHFCN